MQATGQSPFMAGFPFQELSSKVPIWGPTSSTLRCSAMHSQMSFSGSGLAIQRPTIVSPSNISQASTASTSASASSRSVKADQAQITRSLVIPARSLPIVSLSKTPQGSVANISNRASGPALCDDRLHEDPPPPQPTGGAPVAGMKRRLGMGRSTGGYSNKKFKLPT